MDGYTKAAIKEALEKRTERQEKFDDFMERIVNGPIMYVIAFLFYGFWGWLIFEVFFKK